jgi:uncharacterized protein (DUF1778 family)
MKTMKVLSLEQDSAKSSGAPAELREMNRIYLASRLTQHDSRLVMELLENPPTPNAKLRKAARAMPKLS